MPVGSISTDLDRISASTRKILGQTASDAMTRTVVTVGPEVSFRQVVHSLLHHQFHHLPVADEEGRPVGLITDLEVLKQLREWKG